MIAFQFDEHSFNGLKQITPCWTRTSDVQLLIWSKGRHGCDSFHANARDDIATASKEGFGFSLVQSLFAIAPSIAPLACRKYAVFTRCVRLQEPISRFSISIALSRCIAFSGRPTESYGGIVWRDGDQPPHDVPREYRIGHELLAVTHSPPPASTCPEARVACSEHSLCEHHGRLTCGFEDHKRS